MTEFKEVTSRVTSQAKYIFIHALAKQGFIAKDIIDLIPSNISVADGKTLVKINGNVAKGNVGKTAEFTLDETKNIAKYVNANHSKIKEYGLLFLGSKGKLTVPGVTKAFRTYLTKYTEDTLASLGWSSANTAIPSFTFESMDDMQRLLDTLKVNSSQVLAKPKKPKKTVE